MKLKSFLSAAAISLAAWLLVVGHPLHAQQPSTTPTAQPTSRTRTGNLRFWNLTPPTGGIVLEVVVGNPADGRALISSTPSNFYARYIPLVPGQYAIRTFRAGDRQQVIKSFDLTIKDRSYFTLCATQGADGHIAVELMDDTPDPTQTPKNRLTIRQFCPDLTATVTTSGNMKSEPLPYGKTVTLEGLPDGIVALAVHAVKAGDPALKSWDAQADFRMAHHSTLFIVSDLYGRMRARIAMDGPSPDEEVSAAAEVKGSR
ncbi:MAG: DUF4397 domain-containing protein [Rhodospirillales bacterium]|nr:DUF4397 domain-containing protein [Acetobacter sp.]